MLYFKWALVSGNSQNKILVTVQSQPLFLKFCSALNSYKYWMRKGDKDERKGYI